MLLPNVVLFPQTQIPLLIFEPRYRQMIEDVFRGNQRFAIFLTRQRTDEYMSAFSVGCLGEVVGYQKLPNGFYQIVLRGEKRIRRITWDRSRSYPQVAYKELPDSPFPSEDARQGMRGQLLKKARDYLFFIHTKKEAIEKTLEVAMQLSCEEVINWACLLLQFDIYYKQKLLEESEVQKRGRRILQVMQEKIDEQSFLQHFSAYRPKDPSVN